MTRVYYSPNEGPGVHALVIGVGNYSVPWFKIPSAAKSAAMFCEWLLNPDIIKAMPVPVTSVELLLSADEVGGEFRGKMIDRCTVENVQRAALDWMDLASKNQSGITLFYCCGHSILLDRGERVLLLDSFGAG